MELDGRWEGSTLGQLHYRAEGMDQPFEDSSDPEAAEETVEGGEVHSRSDRSTHEIFWAARPRHGSWVLSWKLTGIQDPLEKRKWAGSEQERSLIVAHTKAVSNLRDSAVRSARAPGTDGGMTTATGGGLQPILKRAARRQRQNANRAAAAAAAPTAPPAAGAPGGVG